MTDVVIVGDGPGGLSAALFLRRGGLGARIFGQDKTAMHWAMLNNYLGIESMVGTDFHEIACAQVKGAGAEIVHARVESIAKTDAGFEVTLEGGESETGRYLILSEGQQPRLAQQLGLAHDEASGIQTDRNSRTSVDGVYVVGRASRPGRSQAIISAGDGAAAAIDILSTETGKAYCDWDDAPKK
ncbi:MAG: FAD-dependent oxidoreductase [Myxococcota bacterium]